MSDITDTQFEDAVQEQGAAAGSEAAKEAESTGLPAGTEAAEEAAQPGAEEISREEEASEGPVASEDAAAAPRAAAEEEEAAPLAAAEEGEAAPQPAPEDEGDGLPVLEDSYTKIRDRRHRPSGARLLDVTYGGTDRYGNRKYPGPGDGHGHWIAIELGGEKKELFLRKPNRVDRAAATKEQDDADFEQAMQSGLIVSLEKNLKELTELVRQAELLARKGGEEAGDRSIEELAAEFEAHAPMGSEREAELKERLERAKDSISRRGEVYERHSAEKQALIDEVRAWAEKEEFKDSEAVMADQMERWKRIGSAGAAENQRLWEEFNGIRQAFYQKRKTYYDELKEQRRKSREEKEKLIKEAAETAGNVTSWKEASEAMNSLMDRWKALGGAGHYHDEKLWQQFNAIRQDFRQRRNAFYGDRDQEREESAKRKADILARAKEVADRKDYSKENSDLMKRFNDEWKAAGSAGHDRDEKLWQEYRQVQDSFWEGKHNEHAAARKEYTDKLEAAIKRREAKIENLQNQIYHLKDKMHTVQNPGYLINMGGWVAEKEAAIKELRAEIADMNKRL